MTVETAQTGVFAPAGDSELLKQFPFLPGLQEVLMLRQVHALEHATVWVLSETAFSSSTTGSWGSTRSDNETLGGLSTEKGFYLYGNVPPEQLRRSVIAALQRFREGEWDLAVHPRCGTNVSVALLLSAGLTLGSQFILPKEPIAQLLGVGIGASVASSIAPDVGQWAQQYLTTAIPFNLKLEQIYLTTDFWGHSANFVQLQWQNVQ